MVIDYSIDKKKLIELLKNYQKEITVILTDKGKFEQYDTSDFTDHSNDKIFANILLYIPDEKDNLNEVLLKDFRKTFKMQRSE